MIEEPAEQVVRPLHPRDVLQFPYVFLQRPLLTESEFATEAKARGVPLDAKQLEWLHRLAILMPLYDVRLSRNAVRWYRRHDPFRLRFEVPFLSPGPQVDAIRHALEEGRLRFPVDSPFVPWSKQRGMSNGYAYSTALRLYSPYQLFALTELKAFVSTLPNAYTPSRRQQVRLLPEQHEHYRRIGRNNLQISLILTAIEPYFSLYVMHTIRLEVGMNWEQYYGFVQSVNAANLLERLSLTAEQVVSLIDGLLHIALFDDPLVDWQDLVKLIEPDKWWRLHGQPLLSTDIRIGAELLYQLYEQLVRDGQAPPLEPLPEQAFHVRQTRLSPAEADLDAILMEYGLSPHPSLVLAVEGETELYFVPLVMQRLAEQRLRSRIRVVNISGIDKSFAVLTAYVAMPALGRRISGGALLTRPPTKFLVVYDAEGKAETPEQRADIRRTLVDKLASATRFVYGVTVSRADLDSLVETRTWSDADGAFEYAHFSDEELADGILAASRRREKPRRDLLVERIAEARAQRANLKRVWRGFEGRLPSKVSIAEALWPVLEGKMERAIASRNLDAVPIVRVVHEALQMAAAVRRSSVMIRIEDENNEHPLVAVIEPPDEERS